MRVFVTGGTGFIGQHLVRHLIHAGHAPVCLARQGSRREPLDAAGAHVVFGDVTRRESVRFAMEGCDWVAHLAGAFCFWTPDPAEYQEVNVEGTRNVLETALELGVRKAAHVSTAAVFGAAPWPITEESAPARDCASEYARTKREGEKVAWELHERGLPLVVLYPAAVIGPDDPKPAGRYLERVARHRLPAQILTDHPFAFVHVDDVARAILQALELEGNDGERYIVSGDSVTFAELNQLVAEAAGARLPRLTLPDWLTVAAARALTELSSVVRRPPPLDLAADQVDLMRQGFVLDGSKAERELGLTYTPLKEGVRQVVASLGAKAPA